MRAYAVIENGKPLQEITLPTPEPEGTEVLLEVTHCGVCHSDIHIWEGKYDLGGGKTLSLADRGVTLPLAMGHEIVGRVVKLGPGAHGKGIVVGGQYVVFPWVGCGACPACLAEEDNYCPKMRAIGVHRHGGYATHVIAPEPRHLISCEGVEPALAATYACSGITVYSAINKVMPLPADEPIVLFGAGGLGLAAIAVLRAMGHRRIVSVDVAEAKRAAALAEGASEAVDGSGEPDAVAARILAATGGPVAAAIDLVGAGPTAKAGVAILRKGGSYVIVGLYGGELTLPLPTTVMRALVVRGSHVGNPKELRALMDLARAGRLKPIPVATEPLSHADAVLTRLRQGRIVGRVVLENSGSF
ncbi:alcohol dehydrogenase [Elioraea sp.]|uniref:alcohol dehydrogenase n=1 Tax=Elioraea sp. TaxID=2185103 RepID=UPI0025BC8E0D|nr:alcohol dehydrogenase [Elioraea sp.]